MKRILIATLTLLSMGTLAYGADATGMWQTQPAKNGDYLKVKVAPCGANLCGTIDAAYGSDHKPISGFKDAGKQLIWDMKPDGAGKWSGGKVWSPELNVTANGKLALQGDTLVVSGCKGPICRSQDWARTK
ncbi:DUF2147 domain-containing protein [Hoeflea sp. TYP-13]|uniref:DUF2147 domain-containing protein n=1 Tax=Hoeflea sp. TYP-13 TaxID=3230023 RepID=UPI0034C66EB3